MKIIVFLNNPFDVEGILTFFVQMLQKHLNLQIPGLLHCITFFRTILKICNTLVMK